MIPSIVYITAGVLAAAIVIIVFLVRSLDRSIREVRNGTQDAHFGHMIRSFEEDLVRMGNTISLLSSRLDVHEKKFTNTARGIGVVRFNPFEDSGGNQSFSIALVDEGGNGFVISSLYARERSSVYAKPIASFASPFELTDEEKQAITEAKSKLV